MATVSRDRDIDPGPDDRLGVSAAEKTLILDSIGEQVSYLDDQLTIRWVNRAACRAAGRAASEMVERTCHEIWHGLAEPCPGCPLLRTLADGKTHDAEIDTPDGRIWQIRGYPVRDADGTIVRLVEVAREITDRKVLEENWRRYEFMANASGDFMTLIDRGYVYRAANRAYCQALGRDPSEIVDRTVADVWGERDFRNPIKGYLDRCFSGETVQYEATFGFVGEQRRYYSVRYYPYRGDGETVTHAVVVSHDVTLRRQAEEALRESEERFRGTFEQAAVGICLTDPSGRLIRMNRRYGEMMGYDAETLSRMTFQELTHPDDLAADLEQSQRLLDGEIETYSLEKRYIRGDGTTIWGDLTVSLVRESDGSPKYFIAVVADITDRKRMADEARRQREQLYRADKMVSLGTLVSGVAHEINNPNSFIAFNIPILRDYLAELLPIVDAHAADRPDFAPFGMAYAELRRDLLRLLDNMEHGSSRIHSIVSGLRDFSRSRDESRAGWMNVRPVIRSVIAFCRGKIARMVSGFEIDVPETLPLLWAEPQALEQILINLLINAAQARNKSDGRVWLRVRPGAEPNLTAIEVIDNGVGMAPETVAKVFDPFFTTKPVGEGTGLGLYVCHNLVEGLGGRIEVDSRPGSGSTFRVLLPEAPGDATETNGMPHGSSDPHCR
mgnify:CR=1 FL=1